MTGDADIARRVAALEEAVEELRGDLERSRPRAERGPAPDTVVDLAREIAVPVGIAAVEAQLRLLEGLIEEVGQADRRSQSSLSDWTPGRQRLEALERIEVVLDRLERELRRARVPGGREASDILAETRALRAAIEHQLRGAGASGDRGVEIDVESELASIRADVEAEAGDRGDEDG